MLTNRVSSRNIVLLTVTEEKNNVSFNNTTGHAQETLARVSAKKSWRSAANQITTRSYLADIIM